MHISIICLSVKKKLGGLCKTVLIFDDFRKQTLLKVVKLILTCLLCDFRKVYNFLRDMTTIFSKAFVFFFLCIHSLSTFLTRIPIVAHCCSTGGKLMKLSSAVTHTSRNFDFHGSRTKIKYRNQREK